MVSYKFLKKAKQQFVYISLLILFFLSCTQCIAQNPIELNEISNEVSISKSYAYITDNQDTISIKSILNQKFTIEKNNVPVFPIGVKKVWIKFVLNNQTKESNYYIDFRYNNLSVINCYTIIQNNIFKLDSQGNALKLKKEKKIVPNYIFEIKIPFKTQRTFLFEIESIHPIITPIYLCDRKRLEVTNSKQNIITSLYVGILCALMFYNFFLYITVKDKNYLIYLIYTISILFAQLTLAGYSYMFLWPNMPSFNKYAVVLSSNLSFIAAILFAINFLRVKVYSPNSYKILITIIIISIFDVIVNLFDLNNLSYTILNYNSLLTGITVLTTSIKIAKKGFKPAYLYFVAWSSLFICLILLALRNLNVLPYNNLTAFIFYIGSTIEAILLSFALADKINIYKKEKEESQAQALKVSKENEKLIQEQNVSLEKQVAQRTYDLEKTLRDLKDAQVQLVESEKMASLGQLTAGIAHEINNPINFVKSNVSPLLMDVKDLFELITEYQKLHGAGDGQLPASLQQIRSLENRLDPDFLKEEIENLIGGIEEGAERTAEIVRGLRNFSRLDESEMKEVNIYDNINSTLILLRNATPYYLKIRKHFEARGDIECYPGKLNQVFMNILTNCIHAVKAKAEKNEEEYIDIVVTEAEEYMRIEISDTGVGMTDEVKHKIFDPFFTTKDVGEGTGLGMSIVFKIIEKHHGKISVHSIPGEGAAFTIEIPYMLKTVSELAAEETAMADEELETE